jgi:hypothetical protein
MHLHVIDSKLFVLLHFIIQNINDIKQSLTYG